MILLRLPKSKPVYLLVCIVWLASFQAFCQISYESAFPALNFNFPVEIQNAGDGSDRLFVVEQPGVIKVFPNNSGVSQSEVSTFLDIRSIVSYSSGQEIGLLGLAFHPNFNSNGYFYVYYTDKPGNYRMNLSRFKVSANDTNLADPNSETKIFSFTKNQGNSNHNGGKIGFGPDGYLYISIGDGGGGGDPKGNGQNLNNAFGSILRIDIDLDGSNPVETNPDSPTGNYEIPSDNPRIGLSGLDELYAWGIRNTWKFAFDGNTLWGADVGQNNLEEINIIQKGGNYGWNRFEGPDIEDSSTTLITTPDIKPIFTYGRANGDVSITGGYVYKGSINNSQISNKYIYGDYASGRVWALNYNPSTGSATSDFLFKTSGQNISSFGLDESNELYFSDYGSSVKLYKITDSTPGPVTVAVDGVGDWSDLENGGTDGVVNAIARNSNNDFIIGGSFSQAGNTNANNIVSYSAVNGWQNLGSGSNGVINAVAVDQNGHIYAGGEFSQIGGVSANNIAFWNGSSWAALNNGTNGPVAKIGIDGTGKVYIGGAFETAGGITVNNIALWENNGWHTLTDGATNGIGTNNEIRAIAFDADNKLYVGGNFDSAGNKSAARIAVWDGSIWSTLGLGTSGFVQAIHIDAQYVYAGGNFAIAGDQTVNRIARWNRSNSNWESLDYGLSGNVNSIAFSENHLYVGGTFDTASTIADRNETMNQIARWSDTEGWQALGPNKDVGVTNAVNSLCFDSSGKKLFTGGNFSKAGNTNTNNLAIWEICGSTSIIPEYQVNGTWASGATELEVDSGDDVTLSILPNNTDFTITLPNGNTVNGDYNLGNVDQSDQGTYTFTLSDQGCEATLILTINNVSQDSDGDGVIDANDQCPNTPPNTQVDQNGCPIENDADGDGVIDANDQCPNTPPNTQVDQNGCPVENDADGDGVIDADDQCPNTPPNTQVDQNGCPVENDADDDGVIDADDQCPNTPPNTQVDQNGCPITNDSDGDGIIDSIDKCPNTQPDSIVDEEGCPIALLPTDNFQLKSQGESCINSMDGSITVTAKEALSYHITVNAQNFSYQGEFSTEHSITNLVSGPFEFCITVDQYPAYEYCGSLTLAAPEPLQVNSSIDTKTKSLTLKLSGADEYLISINDEFVLQTTEKEVSLPINGKEVNLMVKTSKECQGVHEETFYLTEGLIVYPNPFNETFFIENTAFTGQGNLYFRTMDGKVLESMDIPALGDKLRITKNELPSGIYLITLESKDGNKILKLVKR
ncbi:PQQ-dependent sugar dehydrogenase [Sediminicola luteus]|uniref:Glucose/Sorbosone dehydrogenase domain-containing protein n=1 Tax=Sediminicola luteus TaxID=319238 RepID=A0A2A4G4D0_9FLAO|nr:PQQ-dependent sugar dehydrogenase [Sediminicola luteus]PCE62595.1 hypothetical protein B7P33_18355 [Sediminicola luteus]